MISSCRWAKSLAIEVKASRRVDARDLKGFETLAARARKLTRRIVVFLGVLGRRAIEFWSFAGGVEMLKSCRSQVGRQMFSL